MEGQKIWNSFLLALKKRISASSFKTWFLGSYVLEFKRGDGRRVLVVGLKNNFLKEQIESRYLGDILEVAKEKGHGDLEIIFVVSQKTETLVKNEPLFSGIAPKIVTRGRQGETLNNDHTLENFVVGSSNNLAFVAAGQVVSNLGTAYNPFLIWGPAGVGKTHLLQAIGNEVIKKEEGTKILYVTAEKFTNDYIESLSYKTQASFRNKYRHLDLLLVDDIQFLAGKESTQDEFFHTFNELYLSRGQIVLACDRHPRELGRLKERLVSRFLGGMVVDIGLADLEMKMAILTLKCHQKNVQLGNEIIAYLAMTSQGGARELEGVLTSVVALSRIAGKEISMEDARLAIEKNRQIEIAKPTPTKIIEAVCRYFKTSEQDLRSPSRRASLVQVRQILMYLLRRELNLPLGAIGELVGGRDHSTVIYGIGQVEKMVLANQVKSDEILRIKTFFHK